MKETWIINIILVFFLIIGIYLKFSDQTIIFNNIYFIRVSLYPLILLLIILNLIKLPNTIFIIYCAIVYQIENTIWEILLINQNNDKVIQACQSKVWINVFIWSLVILSLTYVIFINYERIKKTMDRCISYFCNYNTNINRDDKK